MDKNDNYKFGAQTNCVIRRISQHFMLERVLDIIQITFVQNSKSKFCHFDYLMILLYRNTLITFINCNNKTVH